MPDENLHIKGHKYPSHIPDARIWQSEHIAARFGRSVAWFYTHRKRLEQLGFPQRDRDLGGWDSRAVEAWLDRRAGVDSNTSIEVEMLEAARGDTQIQIC